MKAATQKTAPPAKREAGRDNRGKFTKGNKHRFQEGNDAAEKWTEETVLPYVEKMWNALITASNGKKPKNPVEANEIRLQIEICLMCGVRKNWWDLWKVKFVTGRVFDYIKDIEWLCQARCIKNGTTMDIFQLKAHYGMKESSNLDVTSNGNTVSNPFYEFLKLTSQDGNMDEDKVDEIVNPKKKSKKS
jgi:hypothetical protein